MFCIAAPSLAQSVSGVVSDATSGKTLSGVIVLVSGGAEVITGQDGSYHIALSPGNYSIRFSEIGFDSAEQQIRIEAQQQLTLNIALRKSVKQLDVVVVSGSLYAKNLSRETVSIDVIPSSLIQNTNAVNLSDAITKSPGVYMMDEQANIRGGTGFTYGAGSRVMVVLDDQVLLAPDRGDVKWNFIPMENVQQIEIIKGASSVLYGSSALNGVIAVRTAWPGAEPYNNITVYNGFYDKPSFKPAAWWESDPTFTGMQFSHREAYKKYDLVLGGYFAEHGSYLEGQHSSRGRLDWKTRFHTENKNLTWGIDGNGMLDDEGTFFLWQDPDSGAYLPFGGYLDTTTSTLLNWKYQWLIVDPWLNYFDRHHNEHRFKMRLYDNHVLYSDSTGGNAWLLNLDYRFHREFGNGLLLTCGESAYYFHVRDDELLDHSGLQGGIYCEIDKEFFGRLTLDAGVREEFYQLDSMAGTGVPVWKGGLNYRLNDKTFLRASYGQGYRFPSLVEQYARTSLGALNIFPNPDLSAEYGWNSEVGIKRSLQFGEWTGYADLALYLTDYFDMTEFTFNFYSGEGIGFKSINTSRARIGGMEITLNGEGQVFGHLLSIDAGYNYVYPADINQDSSNLQFGNFLQHFFNGFTEHPGDSVFLQSVLKYRFRHMFRADAEYDLARFYFGGDINYFSLMENLDPIYIKYISGINEYRSAHMHGDWVLDLRVGYRITKNTQARLLVKNVFNRMYALRVAKYDPPRNFTLQYSVTF